MKSINGTPWHVEYLRMPGYRSKRDCCYYADGNCLKLNGVCQGIRFCGKYKETLDASDKKKRCPCCGKIMTSEKLKTHLKTCRLERSVSEVKTVKKNKKQAVLFPCPYCGIKLTKTRLERHINKRCPKRPGEKTKCQYCGLLIRKERLEKHISKKHIDGQHLEMSENGKPPAAENHSSAQKGVSCPYCGRTMLRKYLKCHIEERCPKNKASQQKTSEQKLPLT